MDYDACMNSTSTIIYPTQAPTSTPTTPIPTSYPTSEPTTEPTTDPTESPNFQLLHEYTDDSSAYANETNEHDCHRPITSLPDSYMEKQWAVLWWGTMLLSWFVNHLHNNFYLIFCRLIFPMLSSYFQAGDFSRWERVVRAIKENIILYHNMQGITYHFESRDT
jgi:LMBR1-like membrane protein